MYCGSVLGLEEAAGEEPRPVYADDDEDLDLDNRVLCPDGSCTGIIVDGRCTECGKAYPEGSDAKGEAEQDV